MLPLEHSTILLTCSKQYSVLKTNFGFRFEWPFKTCFTVNILKKKHCASLHNRDVLSGTFFVWNGSDINIGNESLFNGLDDLGS